MTKKKVTKKKAKRKRKRKIPKGSSYLRERLVADVAHALRRAEHEGYVGHNGLTGRLREIVVENLLLPWLPPSVGCATGTVIDAYGTRRQFPQDDIVVYDRALVPSVLASPKGADGVVLYDGVLACVEVKSKLTRPELKKALGSAQQFRSLRFVRSLKKEAQKKPRLMVFAFSPGFGKSGAIEEKILDEIDGYPIGAVCVVGRGLLVRTAMPSVGRGRPKGTARSSKAGWYWLPADRRRREVVRFVGIVSDSCFRQHAERVGGPVESGLGIGPYLGDADDRAFRQIG